MIRNFAMVTFIMITTPAQAGWFGMIYESGSIRQATLSGHADNNAQEQVSMACTVAAGISPNLMISLALPATGQYSVRQGDMVDVSIATAGEAWEIQMAVDTNSSAGFGASMDTALAMEIVKALEVSPSEVTVMASLGPIEREFSISTDHLGRRATEWLDGCGRT